VKCFTPQNVFWSANSRPEDALINCRPAEFSRPQYSPSRFLNQFLVRCGARFAIKLLAAARRKNFSGESILTRASSSHRLEPLRHVDAGVLDVAYYEAGPADGPAVMLLHGFPYDIHSYVDVAPILAAQGCRVIVPYLRGYGPTHFRDPATPRSGEQAALGADLIALIDALGIQRAVFAGYDWGGRAACVGAALWPERCAGLVSLNSYNIQDIAGAMVPARAEREVALWYQYYFQIERGRAGLAANRREIAKILWQQWSPNWAFDNATFDRTATAFDNPDYVDVVIHSYRHRYGLAEGDPQYADVERRLAAQPVISVPAITLDGAGDGVIPATDGSSTAAKFTGPRSHRVIPRAGHNLPQEEPEAFAAAVMELVKA
jgi:pimeloyl-ACP methyl ester carboxylesterase